MDKINLVFQIVFDYLRIILEIQKKNFLLINKKIF